MFDGAVFSHVGFSFTLPSVYLNLLRYRICHTHNISRRRDHHIRLSHLDHWFMRGMPMRRRSTARRGGCLPPARGNWPSIEAAGEVSTSAKDRRSPEETLDDEEVTGGQLMVAD